MGYRYSIPIHMEAVNFRLDGKAALITGAGRGIGLAMAQELALGGAAVAIQDIDLEVAQHEAAAIRDAGGKAIALGGDARDITQPAIWAEQVQRELGGWHILINNAAIQQWGDFLSVSAQDMEEKYRANVIVPVLLCQLAIPVFQKQGWGRIINLGSIQQLNGYVPMFSYGVTKAAMKFLSTSLAKHLASSHITVNCIAPGYFNTWRNREDMETPEKMHASGKHVPMGMVGQPKDCAGAALLLCSDAGSYITGQTIYIDGGMSVR